MIIQLNFLIVGFVSSTNFSLCVGILNLTLSYSCPSPTVIAESLQLCGTGYGLAFNVSLVWVLLNALGVQLMLSRVSEVKIQVKASLRIFDSKISWFPLKFRFLSPICFLNRTALI